MIPYLDEQFIIRFKVEIPERTKMLTDYSELANKVEPFVRWMNDPNVPKAEKDTYEQMLINAMLSMNTYLTILKRCGIPEKEITEWAKIPF